MRPKRTDANQAAIVRELEGLGIRVQSLHAVGAGVPDLLLGIPDANVLVELKIPGGKLNERQIEWHDSWPVPVLIATNVDEILYGMWNHIVLSPSAETWLTQVAEMRERERSS